MENTFNWAITDRVLEFWYKGQATTSSKIFLGPKFYVRFPCVSAFDNSCWQDLCCTTTALTDLATRQINCDLLSFSMMQTFLEPNSPSIIIIEKSALNHAYLRFVDSCCIWFWIYPWLVYSYDVVMSYMQQILKLVW